MARRPRLPWFRCSFTWLGRKVRGRQIMPRVTRQPVDHYCGAQVAVESFQARASILNAKLGLDFPTLSILYMIDMIRDAKARAPNLAQRRAVGEATYPFQLLVQVVVVTKEDYNRADPVDGQHTRNVEGLKHYKLHTYRVCPFEMSLEFPGAEGPKGVADAIEEVAKNGPIFGWFVPWTTFLRSKYNIYKAPKDPMNPGPGNHLDVPHALLLFGIAPKGRKRSVFFHQNNWGPAYHIRGRGVIDCKEFVHAIIPIVQKNWVD